MELNEDDIWEGCPPRFGTRRRVERDHYGDEIAAIAKRLGYDPTPHQLGIWSIATECDEDGRLFYRNVVLLMPRQQAKTSTVLPVQLWRCLKDRRQKVLYGCQDQERAGRILLGEQLPYIEDSDVWDELQKKTGVVRRAGSHALNFKNGSWIKTVSSNRHGARGMTDVAMTVADELYAATDFDLDETLRYTTLHNEDPQLWYLSSAGDETSVLLLSKQEIGRQAVLADSGTGTAYFEWSAPEDAPIDSEDTWYACMPMLAYGILSVDRIREEYESVPEHVFRKELLCQWVTSHVTLINPELWESVCSRDLEVAKRTGVTIAVDASPDDNGPVAVSVAVADRSGNVELLNTGESLADAVELLARLAKELGAPINGDPYGPVGTILTELENRRVKVNKLGLADMAKACGFFYDAVNDKRVHVRKDNLLDVAVSNARKRAVRDVWVWDRKTGVDASPLLAVSIATWVAMTQRVRQPLAIL